MPLPAHPRPNQPSSKQNLATVNGFVSSNKTSNFFLGGPQRAWMSGNQEPNAVSREESCSTQLQLSGRTSETTPRLKDAIPTANKSFPVRRTCPNEMPKAASQLIDDSDTERGVQGALESSLNGNQMTKPSSGDTTTINVPSDATASSNLLSTRGNAAALPYQSDIRHGLGIRPGYMNSYAKQAPAQNGNTSVEATNDLAMPLSFDAQYPKATENLDLVGLITSTTDETEMRKRTLSSTSIGNLQKRTKLNDLLRTPPQTPEDNGETAFTFGKDCLQRLDKIIHNILSRRPLSSAENRRVLALRDAFEIKDHLYCHVHQLECLRMINSQPLTQMMWSQSEVAGFKLVSRMLSLNGSKIQPDLVSYLAYLPTPLHRLQEINLAFFKKHLKAFLSKLATVWEPLRHLCTKRTYPPCARELHTFLSLPSPHLQVVVFTSLLQELFHHENRFHEKAVNLFLVDQRQYIARLKDPALFNRLACEEESQAFGRAYQLCCSQSHSSISPMTIAPDQSQSQSQSQYLVGTNTMQTESRINLPIDNGIEAPGKSSLILGGQNTVFSPLSFALSPTSFCNAKSNPPTWTQTYPPTHHFNTAHGSGLGLLNVQRSTPQVASTQHFTNAQLRAMQTHYPQRSPPYVMRSSSLQTHTPNLRTESHNLASDSSPRIVQDAWDHRKLRASESRNSRPPGQSETSLRLYQVCERYALKPQIVNTTCAYCAWRFYLVDTSAAMKARGPQEQGLLDRPEMYAEGTTYYRLRCVQLPNDTFSVTEADYSSRTAKWPAHCFVSVNQQPMCDILQNLPTGRNPVANLTPWVRDGENLIKVSIQSANRSNSETYSFAIEAIKVTNHSDVSSMVSKIEAPESLSSIKALLDDIAEDDDLVVVDQSVSIDLVDPYMATIWQIPTRGKNCLHRECFDLETFLQSRPSIVRGGPSNPDEWSCPICKRDARPQNLVVDGFLAEVRVQLANDGKLDAKALLVRRDGTWEAKMEKPDGNMKHEISHSLPKPELMSKTTTMLADRLLHPILQTSNEASNALEIIEIDD